jgi:hypothetical protein
LSESQGKEQDNKLQTKKDSIPIATRSGPAISPHPQQPPAATFKRFIERAPELRANAHFLLECAHPIKGDPLRADR